MELTPLHHALAAHLGRELTPEVATAILMQATDTTDRSIDPARFEPAAHGPIVIGVERFEQVLHELHPLHLAHWQETERYRHGTGFKPDYTAMEWSSRCGGLVQFTAREHGQLIGHLRVYLAKSRHSGVIFAQEDTLFVTPEKRSGLLGIRLMRYAETALVEVLGVREIRFESKTANKAYVLARRLKYQPVATQFVKTFKEHDHVR
jgi:hypothetical protein